MATVALRAPFREGREQHSCSAQVWGHEPGWDSKQETGGGIQETTQALSQPRVRLGFVPQQSFPELLLVPSQHWTPRGRGSRVR